MKLKSIAAFAAAAAAGLAMTSVAFAAGSILPGDPGRPGNGIPEANPAPRPPPPLAGPRPARPSVELALQAAQAIADGCKQYPLGVAVVSASGEPILIYIPDRSPTRHAYTAVRKAYSALTLKSDTARMIAKSQSDPELQAQIKADVNLTTYGGGVLLKAGDQTVGAIGVSGAEPGGHDDECAQFGLNAIKGKLK